MTTLNDSKSNHYCVLNISKAVSYFVGELNGVNCLYDERDGFPQYLSLIQSIVLTLSKRYERKELQVATSLNWDLKFQSVVAFLYRDTLSCEYAWDVVRFNFHSLTFAVEMF